MELKQIVFSYMELQLVLVLLRGKITFFFPLTILKNLNLIACKFLTPFLLPPDTLIVFGSLLHYFSNWWIPSDSCCSFYKHLMQDWSLNSFSNEGLWNLHYIRNLGLFDFGLIWKRFRNALAFSQLGMCFYKFYPTSSRFGFLQAEDHVFIWDSKIKGKFLGIFAFYYE